MVMWSMDWLYCSLEGPTFVYLYYLVVSLGSVYLAASSGPINSALPI